MRYFILHGHIDPWVAIEVDKFIEGSDISLLPYSHLGMYGDSIILKVPEEDMYLFDELKTLLPKPTRIEEWKK